jgi:PHD/YefM family antitoxin component YafN of YafNO toxin-antitoxin module
MRAFFIVSRMPRSGENLMPVKEAKYVSTEFEALLKDVAREPVRIQRDGADVAVVLSPEHFRALTRPSYKI